MGPNIFDKKNQVNTQGTLWKPTPGQKLLGTYIGSHEVEYEDSKFGNDNKVLYLDFVNVSVDDVQQDPGERFAVKCKAFLSNSMEKLKPEVGYRIGLVYRGKEKNKFGTDSDAFDVYGGPAFTDPDVEKYVSMNPAPKAEIPAPATPSQASPFAGMGKAQAETKKDVPFESPKELHTQIMQLLAGKTGTTDEGAAKDKAMELTGLAYLPANYEKILAALTVKLGA